MMDRFGPGQQLGVGQCQDPPGPRFEPSAGHAADFDSPATKLLGDSRRMSDGD